MAIQNQRLKETTTSTPATTTMGGTTKAGKKFHTMPAATATTTTTTANGGPRVSFNRDVHVKRIGKRPNELTNYETTNLQPPQSATTHTHAHTHSHAPAYHHQQLPDELNAEDIRKEAALVLAQAERHKSKAENGDNLPIFRVKVKRSSSGAGDTNPKKFHSLPTRKKKSALAATSGGNSAGKPVTRSVSDASAKPAAHKRPSIFNIFSRKSDTQLNQLDRDPRFEDSGGRRLVRSKSDVGSTTGGNERKLKKTLKETKSSGSKDKENSAKQQLTPIIEQSQKEDYFAEQFNRERRKSDAITEQEKHASGIEQLLAQQQQQQQRQQEEQEELLSRQAGISQGIKQKIRTLQAQSQENVMHSSQLPAQKPLLTKGRTVNGLVQRLSMERFSPTPPQLNTGTAFSYIRPNDGITYAQLEHSDEGRRSPPRRMTATLTRDVRDMRSPERELPPVARSNDLLTSQNNLKNVAYKSYNNNSNHNNHNNSNNMHSSRVQIESTRDSFSPPNVLGGATTIRISSSLSPSPWQQLSPRQLSDEDEGLGAETRRHYDDEPPLLPTPVARHALHHQRSQSPAEPPIVPVIRSLTPTREPPVIVNGYGAERVRAFRSPARELDEQPDVVDDLGYRRARLESRILTRRFGDTIAAGSPERQRYLSPERELGTTAYERQRYHKPLTTELLHKYSPERSHLDIIAPQSNGTTAQSTSRYTHTKVYDDGRGGGPIREVYARETHQDGQGKPLVRESRHRERVDSYGLDYEPKSLDSQLTGTAEYRSSPEQMKRYDSYAHQPLQQRSSEEHWSTAGGGGGSSLKRDKLQQRSFDKGDSGIENDFRKESFNGDLSNRWRKRTVGDDMRACEAFLKKERRHTEQHAARRRNSYAYRERSIDDGSHYDPHLDKYPVSTSTLRRRDQHSQTPSGVSGQEATLKRGKKLGGFEKVKQLFTGGGGGSGAASQPDGHSSSSNGGSSKKLSAKQSHQQQQHARANSSTSSSGEPTAATTTNNMTTTTSTTTTSVPMKDSSGKYMVREEEMRSRYSEHRGANGAAPLTNGYAATLQKVNDISTRRRLSTPKASPLLLKRTASDKSKKKHKESPLASNNNSTQHSQKPEKTSWFKSLDRRAKSKSKEQLDVSVNGKSELSSSMKRSKRHTSAPPTPPKNLRFFGDTDVDSNPPTVSRAATMHRSRSTLNQSSHGGGGGGGGSGAGSLQRSQKYYSQSAYHLDRISPPPVSRRAAGVHHSHTPPYQSTSHTVGGTRHKSTSMHNLEHHGGGGGGGGDEVDFRKRRHYSRSRDLDDISESGSETEEQHKRATAGIGVGLAGGGGGGGGGGGRSMSRERLDRSQRYDEHAYRRSNERQTPPAGRALQQMGGPPKPARSAERRGVMSTASSSYARERDRFPAESSGTEGESSLHSQRSVVYLHATTAANIPQPYHLRRRSISRDDLRGKGKAGAQPPPPLQPMTRTVSRSVSMLAPWKPKLVSEGYEINYSQEQNRTMATLPRQPPLHGSSSTLTRNSKKSDSTSARSRSRHAHHNSNHQNHSSSPHHDVKDDLSSLRNSSTTSASKSALSTHLRHHPDAMPRRKLK